MTSQDALNIITIGISTILSVGAIILSIWFYRESNIQNKETALLQTEIKNSIAKLEQLYNRTYTDTFGALKNQMDAMQRHIFSSVGDTNVSEPHNIRHFIIGFITENESIQLDDLCSQVKGYTPAQIQEAVYVLFREKVVEFDGTTIKKNKALPVQVEGEGSA